jgi:hypothetical protein
MKTFAQFAAGGGHLIWPSGTSEQNILIHLIKKQSVMNLRIFWSIRTPILLSERTRYF